MEEEIGKLLQAEAVEAEAIAVLDGLVAKYGVHSLEVWRDTRNKHKHHLVHVIASKGWCDALEHMSKQHKFDLNAQRESDQCTAAHLAIWYKKEAVLNKLWELGADTSILNKYGDSADMKWKEERDKRDNLIFLDLELTCGFYEKCKGMRCRILEAAIVVTDKNLVEKGRGQWAVGGYSK